MDRMHAFLSLVARHREPVLAPAVLERAIGAELYAFLRKARVIVDRPPARRYGCGGFDGPGCPREVIEDGRDPERPFAAVCGNERPHCPPLRLRADDLAEVGVSLSAFAELLARAYGAREGRVAYDPVHDRYELGRAGDRELSFAPSPHARAFEASLISRRGPSRVLIPTRWRVAPALLSRHGPGERVEVAVLEDELLLEHGAPRVRLAERAHEAASEGTRVLVCERGEHVLADDEYASLVANRDRLDLFLDLSAPDSAKQVTLRKRAGRGEARAVELSTTQARVLFELARRRAPLRPAQLRAISEAQVDAPDKLIERLRQRFDDKLGRTSWRWLHTVPSALPDAKQFVFRPPDGATFALIAPR